MNDRDGHDDDDGRDAQNHSLEVHKFLPMIFPSQKSRILESLHYMAVTADMMMNVHVDHANGSGSGSGSESAIGNEHDCVRACVRVYVHVEFRDYCVIDCGYLRLIDLMILF